jgi:hypothetical protein
MGKVREGYLREGDDHHDDSIIERIAERCALCSKRYPTADCCHCQYNTANYGIDPARASMLRTHAILLNQEEALNVRRYNAHIKRENRNTSFMTLGHILILAMLVGVCTWVIRDCKAAPRARTRSLEEVYKPSRPVSSGYSANRVQRALNSTAAGIQDITHDRKINCQDYSILFTRHYGQGSQLYYYPPVPHWPTGHLYVRVESADGWVYIEPQRTSNWTMRAAWPGKEYIRGGRVAYEREFMR